MKLDFNKLIEDTLKGGGGRWSRKSLTLLVSFSLSILIGFFIIVSDIILDVEINRYAIDVFNSFMMLTFALSGVTVVDKKFSNRNPRKGCDCHDKDDDGGDTQYG